MHRVAPSLITAMLAFPQVAAAQGATIPDSIAVRDCRPSEVPIGIFTASGSVGFLVRPDGRPDTASIRVLDVTTVSVAAYRNAAARLLSGCRFRLPRAGLDAPVAVGMPLLFEGVPLLPVSAATLAQLPEGLDAAPVLIPTQGLPLADDDARLEEYPLIDSRCDGVGPGSPPAGMYTSMMALVATLNEWGRRQVGRLSVVLEISRTGEVVPGSVVIEDAEQPRAARRLAERLARCRFAPARIGGVPVPALTRFRIRGAGGPPR